MATETHFDYTLRSFRIEENGTLVTRDIIVLQDQKDAAGVNKELYTIFGSQEACYYNSFPAMYSTIVPNDFGTEFLVTIHRKEYTKAVDTFQVLIVAHSFSDSRDNYRSCTWKHLPLANIEFVLSTWVEKYAGGFHHLLREMKISEGVQTETFTSDGETHTITLSITLKPA